MASRKGSHRDGVRAGFFDLTTLNSAPNPVVTSLAGFGSSLLLCLLEGRFSGLRLGLSSGNSGALDPVATWLAGFAGPRRPQAPGDRTAMPWLFSGTHWRSLDARRSLARSDARTSPNVLTL